MTLHFSEINGPPHTGQTESGDCSEGCGTCASFEAVSSKLIRGKY